VFSVSIKSVLVLFVVLLERRAQSFVYSLSERLKGILNVDNFFCGGTGARVDIGEKAMKSPMDFMA